jgi:hypothetical protein
LKSGRHRVDTEGNRKKYLEEDAMAKATTGRVAQAKAKAPPPASARKAAKAKAAIAPTKKPRGKQAAPKMVAAPRKAVTAKTASAKKATTPTGKKAITLTGKKALPAKKTVVKMAAPPNKAAANKAAVGKAAASKAAARARTVAKSVAVKQAAPRRPATRVAVPTPAPRRGRPPAVARKAPAQKLGNASPQLFTVSHLNEADFKPDGLRAYAHYRDLGIAAATGGLCQAHVIRLVPPCTDEVRKRHRHTTELQLVYVLKGWMKNEFEGQGEQMMSVGSCWLQPSGIEHTVLDYSPDCEVLEIIVPADFKTEDVV